jgi:hypothetical protein
MKYVCSGGVNCRVAGAPAAVQRKLRFVAVASMARSQHMLPAMRTPYQCTSVPAQSCTLLVQAVRMPDAVVGRGSHEAMAGRDSPEPCGSYGSALQLGSNRSCADIGSRMPSLWAAPPANAACAPGALVKVQIGPGSGKCTPLDGTLRQYFTTAWGTRSAGTFQQCMWRPASNAVEGHPGWAACLVQQQQQQQQPDCARKS